jgi:hypothetical protein
MPHQRAALARGGIGLLAGLLLGAMAPRATRAQTVVSPTITVTLGATRNARLSLTLLSGGVQSVGSITDGGTTTFPAPVQLRTEWNLNPGQTGSVNLVAYVLDPSAALAASPTARIPSSQLQGRMATGLPTAFTSFTGAPVGGVGTAGGTLRLFQENISGPNRNRTRTDALELRIDRTGQPVLPAGTYTGTIHIRAITL